MIAGQKDVGRFFRHSTIYALGNAVNRLGAFVLLPVYTHYLSVAEYGQLELFYVVASLAQGLLSVGIAHATLRFYFDYKEQADRNAVVSTNLVATLAIGGLGVLPIALAAGPLSRWVFQDGAMATGILLILATVVLELATQVCLSYVRARERSLLFVGVAIGKLLVQVAVNVVLVTRFNAGVTGVLIGNLAAVGAGFVLLAVLVARECGLRFEWAKLMPVLKYSLPFLWSTIIGVAAGNVDRLLVNGLLDLKALGLFALATKFAKLLSDLIGEPFGQAYGSFRYSIMEKGNAAELQARIMRYLLIGTSFCALGLLYFAGPLLRLIATPEYWESERLLPILVVAAVLRVACYPTQTGIFWSKNTHHVLTINLLQSAVHAGGSLVFIWAFGLTGACVAALVTAIVSIVAYHRFSQRYFRVRYDYPQLAAIAALGVGFHFAGVAASGHGFVVEVAAKCVLLAGFLLVSWRVGLRPDERADLGALLRGKVVARSLSGKPPGK